MPLQRTLCIIKPDAVEKKRAGAILALLEERGFHILAVKRLHLTKAVAEGFYAVHKARPFFGELVQFMTRSPVLVAVLERDDAVAEYRNVMGATDPAKADAGTIRKLYAASIGENAVHGSDSLDNAKTEIAYFFAASEVAPIA
jgi:nucleoside-diphosphate kinase